MSPQLSDDGRWIDEALAGNSAAFGELVLRHQDRLFNTIFQYTGDAEDARDIVQESLVQAFLKLKSFQRRSAFYTWLYRIAFNIAASQHRRRRPTQSFDELRDRTGREPVDGHDGPAVRLDVEERRQQVRDAMAGLDEEFRSVLVLREIDGCCYETISDILDLPIGTVRSRLHRARLQLRDALKQMQGLEIGE